MCADTCIAVLNAVTAYWCGVFYDIQYIYIYFKIRYIISDSMLYCVSVYINISDFSICAVFVCACIKL